MSLPDFLFERVTTEVHQQMDGVLALAERLTRQPLAPDAQACVAGVLEAAAGVREILDSIRDLKAASDEGLALETAPTRLRDLMDQVQARWEAKAAQGAVTLLVAYDGDPDALAEVDAARLMHVFDGFIGQALASARRGGVEASLKTATASDGQLRLEGRVRDGSARPVAFDASDIAEIDASFGLQTALGVALAREVLKALDGTVRVERNRGLGETVVFEILAPIAEEIAEAPADTAGPARAAHILIVDDNATNRMVAETLCDMFDCTSESVGDGVEAVEAARSGRFDLILMDIKMPRMDGVAATETIRSFAGPAGQVPIIALTANADPEEAAGYRAAGMNGVVEKPMKPENLLQALQEALADEPEPVQADASPGAAAAA